ncbi:hypothetical protein GCM10020254_68320 [Streptomyces goshikiensis]
MMPMRRPFSSAWTTGGVTRREGVLLEAAEEVRLAVVRERGAVGADELRRVVHGVAGALRVAVQDGDPVAAGDLADGAGGHAVGRFGDAGDVLEVQRVAGQEHLRGHEEPGPAPRGTLRRLFERLEVLGGVAEPAGALEEGGAQRGHGRTSVSL